MTYDGSNYHDEVRIKNTLKLRERLKYLPPFLKEFFRGIENNTSSRTRIGYAYDLNIFFCFLTQHVQTFMNQIITELTIEDLAKISIDDIEDYMDYLSYYVKVIEQGNGVITEHTLENEALGKSRKLSSLRSMFSYFYMKRKIATNPSDFVEFPKIHEKTIVRLESNEIVLLLDMAESGENLTEKQQGYHNLTKKRDLAILMLLLGTGMRVSECIGINISHIDFSISGVKVTRKGGDEAVLYFSDEVGNALSAYLDEREKIETLLGHEDALFLSLQRRRLTDRAVQNLVKKYAQLSTIKKITPHKLRSTFGTQLYEDTGDIYLVADVLGHADVNTTRKHYAAMNDDRRRKAARNVRLRDDRGQQPTA